MRYLALLAIPALTIGCTTIQVPMPGGAIGRPYAATGTGGVRMSIGIAELPNVQGVTDEVRDPDGQVINLIPDEPLTDDDGNILYDENGEEYKEAETSLGAVIDFGVNFAENYEFGFGSTRGVYFLADLIKTENYSFSITPAYAEAEVEVGSSDLVVEPQENGELFDSGAPAMEGRVDNANLTALGSLRLMPFSWMEFAAYGGLGFNHMRVRVKDRRTQDKAVKEVTAPSAVLGLYSQIWIFGTTVESQIYNIPQRDGSTATIVGSYIAANLVVTL